MNTIDIAATPDYPSGFTQRVVPVTVHLNKPVQQVDPLEVQWPLYGLPLNYTPPFANDASNQTTKPQVSDAKVADSQVTPPQGSVTSVVGVTPTPSTQQVLNSGTPSSQEKDSVVAVRGGTPAHNVQWFPWQQTTNFGVPNQSTIFGAATEWEDHQ
ncbi:Gypsy retrotransposon integrase-like protein 1 [Sesbania bispinosa]|nr:Gypsy retrotransposon integrase-like protein 1 [Sesbania bispinosa]